MKKLVGKRLTVNPDQKAGLALLATFTLGGPAPTSIIFKVFCNACKSKATITLTEDVPTGDIWLEGPDKCEGCGHQFTDPDATYSMLSQKQIEDYFGPF